MALHAGGQLARHVALLHQLASALQHLRPSLGRRGWRIGHLQPGKVGRNLAQIVVCEVLDEVAHLRITAPPLPKIDQLVEQVTRRLAREAREKSLLRGAAFLAVAGGAGQHARPHGAVHIGGGPRSSHGRHGRQCTGTQDSRPQQRQHITQGAEQAIRHGQILAGTRWTCAGVRLCKTAECTGLAKLSKRPAPVTSSLTAGESCRPPP